jgi:hypothetical protein
VGRALQPAIPVIGYLGAADDDQKNYIDIVPFCSA